MSNIKTIGFFLSGGAGYNQWKKIGSFEREMALYQEFAKKGWKVKVYSYDKIDKNEKMPNGIITIIFPFTLFPRKLNILRQLALPFAFWIQNKKSDVVITNQAHNGGFAAVLAGEVWRIKVIARSGYIFGEWIETERLKGIRYTIKRFFEKLVMRLSDRCIITTVPLIEWVVKKYQIPEDKISLIPNFVLTDQFKPSLNIKKEIDVIHIGRLSREKRPFLILEALEKMELIKVLFIGDGPLKIEIEGVAKNKNIPLKIIESVFNAKIPEYINKSKVFIIASTREGHPKALIEAMSCGCICIGADRPGINNIIKHNENGLLFNSTVYGLIKMINYANENKILMQKIAANAREYIIKEYSFDKIYKDFEKVISG